MRNQTHGTGEFRLEDLGALGADCVLEPGVLVFHPESVFLGTNVYVGHQSILKGYYKNRMEIGNSTWIGQQCFLHSAGGLRIASRVGIGPGVKILTSHHAESDRRQAIYDAPLMLAPVCIEHGADIGVGAIILPGVTIGEGAQVGAGSVVTRDVPAFAVVAGSPARVLRERR